MDVISSSKPGAFFIALITGEWLLGTWKQNLIFPSGSQAGWWKSCQSLELQQGGSEGVHFGSWSVCGGNNIGNLLVENFSRLRVRWFPGLQYLKIDVNASYTQTMVKPSHCLVCGVAFCSFWSSFPSPFRSLPAGLISLLHSEAKWAVPPQPWQCWQEIAESMTASGLVLICQQVKINLWFLSQSAGEHLVVLKLSWGTESWVPRAHTVWAQWVMC